MFCDKDFGLIVDMLFGGVFGSCRFGWVCLSHLGFLLT